ncbi:hypothetical protein Q9189_002772 [Teloschistes chrysophthalmus]
MKYQLSFCLASFLSYFSLLGSSSSLQPRARCDADNCLRALRRHNISASPFCSTYMAPSTLTVTGSTTQTIYSVISPSSSRPSTTPTASLPLLNDSFPVTSAQPYATPCSSTPRLSSACACLLSTAPPIYTTTLPLATTTVSICDPTANDGINYQRGQTDDLINTQLQRSSNTTDAHKCCATCFGTPGCLTYALLAPRNVSGGGCELSVAVEGSLKGPGLSDTCPFGVYEAFNGRASKEVGLGPCVDYHRGF